MSPLRTVPLLTLLGLAIWAVLLAARPTPPPLAEADPPAVVPLPEVSFAEPGGSLIVIVLDAEGEAVPEALVVCETPEVPTWGYSDGLGRVRLDGVPVGTVTMLVVAHGHAPERREVHAQGVPMELRLAPPFARPPRLADAPMASLHGVVAPFASGEDPAGSTLFLLPVMEEGDPAFHQRVPHWIPLGPGGAFALDQLAISRYRLALLPPWAGRGSWRDLMAPLGAEGSFVIDHPAPGQNGDGLLLAPRAGALRGRLRAARKTGAAPVPVRGALVFVSPASQDGRAPRHWPPVVSDEDGRFLVDHLPAGEYRVVVRTGAEERERVVSVLEGKVAPMEFGDL